MRCFGDNKWIFLVLVTLTGLGGDLISKYYAVSHLSVGGDPVKFLGSTIQFQLVYNQGALFGLNPQSLFPSFPTTIFFFIISAITLVMLLLYYHYLVPAAQLTRWGISLVMPGAIGNLSDRLFHAELGVVDFIRADFNIWPFNPWPIFNIADAFITVGLSLVIIDMVIQEKKKKKVCTTT